MRDWREVPAAEAHASHGPAAGVDHRGLASGDAICRAGPPARTPLATLDALSIGAVGSLQNYLDRGAVDDRQRLLVAELAARGRTIDVPAGLLTGVDQGSAWVHLPGSARLVHLFVESDAAAREGPGRLFLRLLCLPYGGSGTRLVADPAGAAARGVAGAAGIAAVLARRPPGRHYLAIAGDPEADGLNRPLISLFTSRVVLR